MSLVRLTPELYEKLNKSMGLSAQQIREGINAGSIAGQKAAPESRIYLIDDKYLPKDAPLKTQAELEAIDETKSIFKDAETIKAETAKIEAEIKLAVAKGERDKPEILAQKEKDLITLQQNLDKKQTDLELRENSLVAKIVELDGREQSIAQREMDLNEHKRLVDEELARKIKQNNDTIAQMLEDAEQLKQSILDDKDGELLQRQGELDGLNKEIAKQQKTLDDLHKEWETVIVPKQKDLQDIIDVANKYIEYHYSKAEKSKGKLQDYHYDRTNLLWDIKDKATEFLKRLVK